jgi:hypothetical protein
MRRPEQHTNADIAVNAVRQIFNDVGYAVDEVVHDYGEDLVVQTSLDGEMDPSRIWVQVKGTRRLTNFKRGVDYAVRVSLPHARKWLCIPDLVVVVLWDITAGRGFWATPRSLEFTRELARLKPDLRIPLSRHRVFDRDAAIRLAWMARIENVGTRLAQVTIGQLFDQRPPPASVPEAALVPEMTRDVLALELLQQLGVVKDGGITEQYAAVWRDAWNAERQRDPLARHVISSTRMLDTRFAELGPDVTYSTQILASVILMLLRTIRPGASLEIPGCDWSGDLMLPEEIMLIDPVRSDRADRTDTRDFVARLGEHMETELANIRGRREQVV